MVSEVVEAPAAPPQEEANQAPPAELQTEAPPEGEGAVAVPDEEAVASPPDDLQVEVIPPAPEYLTRADAEKLVEERAERIRADEREAERNRRRTENANKANAEERSKRRLSQTVDTVKATLVARGFDPDVASDESIITAIDRVAEERAEDKVRNQASVVGEAWEYLTAPAYGKELEIDDSFKETARELSPKLQSFINHIRPQIEAEARKGYVAESEIPARVSAEIASRNAKAREGQEELVRPDGAPSTTDNSTLAERLDRIGTPAETAADDKWWEEREASKKRR